MSRFLAPRLIRLVCLHPNSFLMWRREVASHALDARFDDSFCPAFSALSLYCTRMHCLNLDYVASRLNEVSGHPSKNRRASAVLSSFVPCACSRCRHFGFHRDALDVAYPSLCTS